MTPEKAWCLLIFAGLLEPIWITLMIKSDGFSRPWFVFFGATIVALEFGLFNYSLSSLPINLAYSIWVAISALSVFILSFYMGETVSMFKFLSFFLIIVGIAGMKYSS
jgi:quaternary ammonium compound-resistance protein SugE